MDLFSKEQREFIEDNFNQTKNDKIIEDMSHLKSFIPSTMKTADLLDDTDVFMNVWEVKVFRAERKIYQCICGKMIKNEYRLSHKYKDITLSLGEEHYKQYCGISVSKIENIRALYDKYMSVFNELAELLQTGEYERHKFLLNMEDLPVKLRKQLELGIPLFKSQLQSLEKKSKTNYRLIKGLERIEKNALIKIDQLNETAKQAILIRLKNGLEINNLEQLQNINYDDISDLNKEEQETTKYHGKVQISSNNKVEIGHINTFENREQIVGRKSDFLMDASPNISRRDEFIEKIKDECERRNIIENTKKGINKITPKEALKYSSKLHRQVSYGFSLSDKQIEMINNPQLGDEKYWKSF